MYMIAMWILAAMTMMTIINDCVRRRLLAVCIGEWVWVKCICGVFLRASSLVYMCVVRTLMPTLY